jgi:hypothetical protein
MLAELATVVERKTGWLRIAGGSHVVVAFVLVADIMDETMINANLELIR